MVSQSGTELSSDLASVLENPSSESSPPVPDALKMFVNTLDPP